MRGTEPPDGCITPAGLRRLERQLLELSGPGRHALAQRLRDARATMSDTHEGPEYADLLQEADLLEGRIAELMARIAELRVVDVRRRPRGLVTIGSEVVVDLGGELRRFTVVGSDEADVLAGRISTQSPLGAALLGHRSGDPVEWEAPSGTERGRVVRVA